MGKRNYHQKNKYMHFLRVLLFVLLCVCSGFARAQKAWQGDITALLSKIPMPGSSSISYAGCTKITDPSTGLISIKDNGPGFTDLEAQLDKIATEAMAGASAQAAAAQSASPQQMAQQYRSNSGAPSPAELVVMKLIGQAQTAAGHINQLTLEVAQKKAKIFAKLDSVKLGPVCPEVQQGGYAGPTCACLKGREVDYRTRRTPVMDSYVQQVAELYREYLAKMKVEAAIVDDMESKAKYGDAVSNPAFRQMVVSIQRQALVSVTTMMSLSGSAWNDSAKEYALLMNARSGASVPCGKK